MKKQWLTIAEVARALQVQETEVCRLVGSKVLRAETKTVSGQSRLMILSADVERRKKVSAAMNGQRRLVQRIILTAL